jgi:hypothetical protein
MLPDGKRCGRIGKDWKGDAPLKTLVFLFDVIYVFVITMVVAIVVSGLWNLVAHKAFTVDWTTAFRMAITLGIVLPLVKRLGKKEERR